MNLLPIASAPGAWTPQDAPLWTAAVEQWQAERAIKGVCVEIQYAGEDRYRVRSVQRRLTTLAEVRCYLETGTSFWMMYTHTGKYPVCRRVKDEVIAHLRSRCPIRFS